jgi:hypothetical protein
LVAGFEEIYLSGIDLYEDDSQRYCYQLPPAASRALAAKDKSPGYEPNHSRDSDVAFLMACLAEYPRARIYSISSSSVLNQLLPRPTAVRRAAADSPTSPGPAVSGDTETANDTATSPGGRGLPRLGQPKDQPAVGLSAVPPYPASSLESPAGREPYGQIGARRCAYVTAVTSADYCPGALALANSLARTTRLPLIALVTPDVPVDRLLRAGIHIAPVQPIANPHLAGPGGPGGAVGRTTRRTVQARFASVFTKLHAWRLDYLDRIVFLDADTIVLQNIDQLFEGNGFAAAPDWGAELTEQFNTGLFVTEPSSDRFQAMTGLITRLVSADGGDQGFLNSFFPDWTRLASRYNTLVRLMTDHPQLYRAEDVAVLHYVGPKPWQHSGRPFSRLEADRLWLDYLEAEQLRDLIIGLRGVLASEAGQSLIADQLAGGASRAAKRMRFRRARRLRRAALELDPGRLGRRPVPRWDRPLLKWAPESWLRLALRTKRIIGRVR